MRTAELLEISSLCEGQKNLSGRIIPSTSTPVANASANTSYPQSVMKTSTTPVSNPVVVKTNSANKRSHKDNNGNPSKTRKLSGLFSLFYKLKFFIKNLYNKILLY